MISNIWLKGLVQKIQKQKYAYPYEFMDNFKRFKEEKLPDRKGFYSSVKDGTTGDNGEKIDGHISDEDYLTCKKFEMNLTWKIWVIITIIFWKKMFC